MSKVSTQGDEATYQSIEDSVKGGLNNCGNVLP